MAGILYATTGNPNSQSCENNGHYIGMALTSAWSDVRLIQLPRFTLPESLLFGAIKSAYRIVGKDYKVAVEPRVVSRQVGELLKVANQDKSHLVFSNGPVPVYGLGSRFPYVIYSDGPVAGLEELGHFMDQWPKRSIANMMEIDKTAVLKAESVFYHSEWAAECAIRRYGVSPDKVHVVSPGANFDFVPIEVANENKSRDVECQLLFFGRDWERKGGPIAYKILREVQSAGVPSRLTICGPKDIPSYVADDPSVEIVEPIRKDFELDRFRMIQMFRSTDYLVLPTHADTSTSAIREASAFGVPSVSTRIGGLVDLVRDNEGILLPRGTSPAEYAARITANFLNEGWRLELRKAARLAYETRMTWTGAMTRILEVLISKQILSASSVATQRE